MCRSKIDDGLQSRQACLTIHGGGKSGMITNPKQYLGVQGRAREEFLRRLSQEESVRLLESLLTSGLVEEFTFSDHQPVALAITIRHARERV